MSKKDKRAKFRDAQAAFACAESFHAFAEELISAIPFADSFPDLGKISDDIERGFDEMPTDLANIVVCATNLALALELYMKGLLSSLQGVEVPEKTHDLWELYQTIPLEIRKELVEEKYKDAVRSNAAEIETKLKAVLNEFGLPSGDTRPYWFYDEENLTLLMPHETGALIDKARSIVAKSLRRDLRGSITIAQGPRETPVRDHALHSNQLEEVFRRSRNIFVSWRYIFEFTQPTHEDYQFHEFEYRSLLFAFQALRETVHDLMSASGS